MTFQYRDHINTIGIWQPDRLQFTFLSHMSRKVHNKLPYSTVRSAVFHTTEPTVKIFISQNKSDLYRRFGPEPAGATWLAC